ncbi:hypothetical protein VNO80_26810 [Phaseolus coccineus]|uniref:Uncharacterized protein n=1 Tax=Phaseolus coccineus TaxID=3886 RepID=A0AAN9LFF4_PHACN
MEPGHHPYCTFESLGVIEFPSQKVFIFGTSNHAYCVKCCKLKVATCLAKACLNSFNFKEAISFSASPSFPWGASSCCTSQLCLFSTMFCMLLDIDISSTWSSRSSLATATRKR